MSDQGIVDKELAQQFVDRAKAEGVKLTGPGDNSRNGTRTKTVISDVGPVDVDVPRDRDGTFEPAIVRKHQRRLGGVDDMVLSLSTKGLTTAEISAHLAEVYGASVSKDTISVITDRVLGGPLVRRNGRSR